ncbi:MAG: tRNA 4-thiouridine(8) synthase ThiI [Syntrophobacterales bacterium]|jgi:tRNA U34 2-thiouridine synthase MnmA/TrmU|nr:tRNA 4-thiouridine(8) synthase ThiI [Syntrophobacterales bacterium]
MTKTVRALGLFSGGLDSMLAAAVLRAQGIEVTLICFVTPFFGAERARESAAHLNLPLRVVDFTEKFLPLIYDPPHGWGRGHNPCIDCHTLMIREAGAMMAAEGFDLVFTGEVLGQRPMSQNRGSLNLIARDSGIAERLLRPLSAKSLKATQPEVLGRVDRERLLNLSGRGRKRQIALAEEYGIKRYPAPAGGCLLTDPGYARRLKELLARVGEATRQELELLKWGRQFRLPGGAKAVVGRTQRENEALLSLKTPADFLVKVEEYPGPLVLVGGAASDADREAAAGLAAAYSDAPEGTPVTATAGNGGPERVFHMITPGKERYKPWLV